MSMLTLQVLGLLLLFGLIGAFVGWLIRPFFCKGGSTAGRNNLSGSAATGSTTSSSATAASKSKASGSNKTAAAAGIAAAAATAAVAASSKKGGGQKAAKTATNEKAAADAKQAAAKAKADDAAKKAEIAKKAEEQRAAAKKANDAKLAEENRLAAEKAKAAKAEKQRLADERAKADQAAAAEKAKVEADRLAAEKPKADQAAKEAAAKAEADKLAAIEADKKKLAAEAQAARDAEAERLAAEKAKADQAAKDAAAKAEADRLAAEKAKADQAAKDAAAKAEADRLAAEKAKADQAAKDAAAKAEADRLAAEKAKADQAAKDAAAKAEADRLAAEKAKADQAAKDAAAKAEADRLAAEKAKADQAAKDAAAKAEADRLAAEKAKADQAAKANAAKIAAAATAAAASAAVATSGSNSESDDLSSVTDDMRPERLSSPRGGKADDLKRIKGIGPVIEGTLNEEGVYHFQQVADFTPDNIKWVDKNVAIPGRVQRDDWTGQAQALIDGREYDGYAKDIAGTDDPSLPPVTEDMRPEKLAAPLGGKADDLKRINGIGPVIEKTLNNEGIYHFKQIAEFTPDNVNWVDRHISFPGRITREEWIRQAKGLAAADGVITDDLSNVTDDMRPEKLSSPRGGKADDLQRIKGIGPVIEGTLNEEGVYHFQQIADFTPDNVKWVDKNVAIPGRVYRDDWIGQSQSLIDGREYDGYAKDTAGIDDPSLPVVTEDMRPEKLAAPLGGSADDLKRIKGIGPVIEKTLNTEGIYHFKQIADFTPDNVNWVDRHISFPGRITREEWIRQAKGLAAADGVITDDLSNVTDDMRPEKLATPRGGKADDLKRIKGIGPVIEGTLNEEGVYHFQQIADFTPDNVKWVDKNVAIPGRVYRDDWIGQSQSLIDGSEYDGYAKDIAGTDDPSLPPVTEDMRPEKLPAPMGGKADDLKRINGIGPVIEKTLNNEGIYHFKQIADFTPDNVNWVDRHISFPGRITREEWIRQAKGLAAGNDADMSSSVSATGSETVEITEDMRPTRRSLESGQKADDLKVINGIGPVIEKSLNAEGVYFYQQIADFNEDNTKWVDNHMAFPGRIHREDWIGQAKILVGQKGISTSNSNVGGKASEPEIIITEDMRPARKTLSAGDKPDDLKVINGIGPVIEKSLNAEGIFYYQQIADFNEDNTKWVDNHMAFPGRIHRENWIAQAKVLVGQQSGDSSQSASTSAVGSALGSSGAVPESMKPTLLSAPDGGKADDLKRIKGIGKVLERNLHEMGIYHYEQLAELTEDNIKWLTDYVSFPEGRIDDENWTGQAKALAEGKQTEYSQRFDKGDTPYK